MCTFLSVFKDPRNPVNHMKEIHPNSFVLGSLNGCCKLLTADDLIRNHNSHYNTILIIYGSKFYVFCKIIDNFIVRSAFSL